LAKSKKRGKKKEPAPAATESGSLRSAGAVRRSFAKATKELSQTLRGAEALYRIPWFGMIGEPGCGKSDLLVDSGLNARPGSPDPFGMEPPGANLWWFFSDAVVIDFADEYFGGADDGGGTVGPSRRPGFFRRMLGRKATAGGSAWKIALDALRENRKKRPLDGMVLTVDVETLRARTPEQVGQLSRRAEAVAERIQDAQFNLAVQFPVYVVLTNCENLPGFEAYARSLPEPMRDQMFGWSSPHEPDTSYQPEWVDEAIGSLHESACVGQLELLPQAQTQAERDEIYMLPRELAALVEPLKQYLEPVFKSGSFRKGVPLRGIYMTGRVDDKPRERSAGPPPMPGSDPEPIPGPTGRPRFVRQLFSEKIFQEPGLAKIDQDASRVINKKVRRARLALIIGLVVALAGLTWQRYATSSRVEKYGPLVQILKAYQDKAKYGGSSVPDSSSGVGALEALASIQVQRLEVIPVPTSYIVSDLTAHANRAVAHVLGDGVGRPLRDEMERKADGLLPPSLETDLPGDSRTQADAAAAAGQLQTKTPQGHVADLRGFVDDVITLDLNVKRYNNHDSRDLGQVYLYLTGRDITETLESKADWYQAALRDISGWPTLSWPSYGNRARIRALQLFEVMQAQLFRENPLRGAMTELVELIDTIEARKGRESYYDRLKAIYLAVNKLEALIDEDKAVWLLNEKFDPGPRYAELVEALNTDAFPQVGDETAGQELARLGKHFDTGNQKQYKALRDFVWASKSKLGRFNLLDRREGKVVLSEKLSAVQGALKDFIEQPYIIDDETQFTLDLQRDAGSREAWNADLLAMVLTWTKGFVAYVGAQRAAVPTAINTALDTAARKEFRGRVLLVMRFASPEALRVGDSGDGATSWTAARKDALKERVRNLAEHYQSILKISEQLTQVSNALLEPVDAQVFNALRDDGLDLLNKVNSILEQEKLYTIRSDQFSWWEGDQPPGVVAFGARDANDLVARLGVQRKAITTLSNEFARPLVDVMIALGEPFSNDPDVEKWKQIIAVLTDYEKKVPGNSLEELERFIEVELNKLQLASCQEKLESHVDRFNRTDFFKKQKYEIGTAMSRRCNQILKTVTLQGYVDLANFFTERLAGRFPYSGPDILADAEPADIVEFYKRFDRYAGAFKALVKPGRDSTGGLFGKATGEVLRFLQQAERVRQLYAGLLQSEDDNPDLSLDVEFDFRVNRDNEVNGNQIIQWFGQVADERIEHRDNKRATKWKTNDGVSVCFRWAKDAMFLPGSNQRSEQARVNGRTACYAYTGRWALMRLLVQHAATPADRGRRSFLRPHTLRFETETRLASATRSANSLLVTDTRVYVRVSVMTPGGKSAFRIPEFPRRAPELSVEFLKSNGIVTDGGKGGY
jgi:type VI secretion system protein ImpL